MGDKFLIYGKKGSTGSQDRPGSQDSQGRQTKNALAQRVHAAMVFSCVLQYRETALAVSVASGHVEARMLTEAASSSLK